MAGTILDEHLSESSLSPPFLAAYTNKSYEFALPQRRDCRSSLRIEMKSLMLLFLAYNLLLASVLIGPLAAPRAPVQQTTTFSDSDFGSPTPPPTPPIRISKPFHADRGEALSFSFEAYGVNNVTEFVISSYDCGACEMAIVALPLGAAPYPAENGTLLLGSMYNVTRSGRYVLIFDTRSYLPCAENPTCIARLSGNVTATISPVPNPYGDLPVGLAAAGLLVIIPPVVWTVRRERRDRANPGEL